MGWCGAQGQPYLGQQLGEVLHKDTKGGAAEGQVAGSGVWLHGAAGSLVRILGAAKLSSVSPARPGELGPGSGNTGWAHRWGVGLGPRLGLTLAPFTAADDSNGRSSREAGWPRSGGVAWMMTRRSWGPTMPQPWATVTAVCRLSPRSVGAGSGPSCHPGAQPQPDACRCENGGQTRSVRHSRLGELRHVHQRL